MARVKELLYAKSRRATVAVMSDGATYVLPAIRDPVLVAKFLALARSGQWELSYTEEGMKLLLEAPDLERQVLSF